MSRLTDISVRKLPIPSKGQKLYYDDILPAFGCRVSQGGTRSFFVQHGADRQFTTIGRYPIISLSDARTEAKRILAERTLGRHRPRSIAWDDALKDFLAACAEKNRPRTVRDYTRVIRRHFPFGNRRLSEITHEEVTRQLDKLADTPSERNHALTAVKIFFRWAQRPPRRYIPHNPCEGMTRSKRPSRKRVLSEGELVKISRTVLQRHETIAHITGLLLLTGQRPGEITGLQWDWIDAKERTITLPGEITKNGREHTFPYPDAAAQILDRVPKISERYLFPATREHVRGKPTTVFNDWTKSKTWLDMECGVVKWTLHDLRRTFATGLAQLKVPPHVVEKLLNHSFGSISNQTQGVVSAVAEVYNRHTYLPEMRDAVSKWETHLGGLLRPTPT